MRLLETPIEVVIAILIAAVVRLKSSWSLGWIGALTTTIVSMFSGLLLYQPVLTITGIDQSWDVLVAILISLTAENLMKGLIDFTGQKGAFQRILMAFLTRDASHLNDKK